MSGWRRSKMRLWGRSGETSWTGPKVLKSKDFIQFVSARQYSSFDVKLGPDRTAPLYDIEKLSLYTNFDTLRNGNWSDAGVRQLRGEIEVIVGVGHLGTGTRFADFGLIHLSTPDNLRHVKNLLTFVIRRIAASAAS